MPHELVFRPEAEAEVAEAYGWYEERVQGLGDQFLLSIDAVLQAIARAPHQYPAVFKAVRRAILHRFPYLVLLVESEERVTVLAVFHGKRDPRQWKKKGKPSNKAS